MLRTWPLNGRTAINHGEGQHFLLITVGDFREYLKVFYVLNISLNLAIAFIKLSLLFQFLRIFTKGTWPYTVSVVNIVLVSLWGLAFTLVALFPCAVISDAWNIFATNSACWGYGSTDPDAFTATFVAHNVMNTIFDVVITLIPIQLYFQPNITMRTRMGLMVLLLMGAMYVTSLVFISDICPYYISASNPTSPSAPGPFLCRLD